jgi:molecular chaperone IbpA
MLAYSNSLFVGFDDLFASLTKPVITQSYPHFDMVRLGDSRYKISVACAGFDAKDLSVTVAKNRVLTIKGDSQSKTSDGDVLHQGISKRSFARSFTLAESIKVESVDYDKGILTIMLYHEAPPEPEVVNYDVGYTRPKTFIRD